MSTLETQMAGRRVAARNAGQRKKLVLVGLVVLLAGLLAFQLPKLLKGSASPSSTAATSSGSSSSTAAPSAATTATSTAATPAGQSVASAPASTPAERARAIQQMQARDPFVPSIPESAPASAPSSTPAPAPARSSAPTRGQSTLPSPPLTALPAGPTPTSPAAGDPGLASPAAPTAATIWTNGKRQVVGVAQTFDVGDATFKLVGVDRAAMRLQVAGGAFTGGKRTITIREGHRVILENKATGVRYTLRFAGATTEAAPAQPTDPLTSIPGISANPFGSLPGGTSASNGS